MKQLTIRDFFNHFPDDESCLTHIFESRFGQGHQCPKCHEAVKWYRFEAERAYACGNCGHHLHPTVGTPFEGSRTALQLWFYAIYLFTSTRHGVSAKELQRQLGVTYKTAWRMGHEIRKHMADVDDLNLDKLVGHVEIDETYIGGKTKGQGNKKGAKTIVIGMLERNGDVVTKVIPSVGKNDIMPVIEKHIGEGTTITTDKLHAYQNLPDEGFAHFAISKTLNGPQHVVGPHHTNTIEGYWHILKSSIAGTHMHVSEQHLSKYLGEFEYRHNNRVKKAADMFPELISTYPA